MKAIDIIDALTRMGCTEGTGVVETPESTNKMYSWIFAWFGGDYSRIDCDRELKTNTKYLYSYDTKLFTLKGICEEDAIIEIEIETAESNETYQTDVEKIYLYEIE